MNLSFPHLSFEENDAYLAVLFGELIPIMYAEHSRGPD